jgi:hypothetical protein
LAAIPCGTAGSDVVAEYVGHQGKFLEPEKLGCTENAGTAQKTSFAVIPIARRKSGSESISE